jgi:hypothetical protein
LESNNFRLVSALLRTLEVLEVLISKSEDGRTVRLKASDGVRAHISNTFLELVGVELLIDKTTAD